MYTSEPLAVAVVALLLVVTPLAGATTAGDTRIRVAPGPLELGDASQQIHVAGELPAERATLTIDVTALREAGVDLSAATVRVTEGDGVTADPRIERSGGAVLLHVPLSATGDDRDFRLDLRLAGLDTAGATTTTVHYGATVEGATVNSLSFEIRDPAVPQVSKVVEPTDLVTGERNASQHTRVILFEAPRETSMTVDVNVSALRRANVSLAGARVSARASAGDVDVRRVERDGTTVTITARSRTAERFGIELVLSGLDTRGAEPTTGLQYEITAATDAGHDAEPSEPFGVYRPGETPSPTPTPHVDPITTETPTPNAGPTPTPTVATPTVDSTPTGDGTDPSDGTGAGFGVVAPLVALVASLVVIAAGRRGAGR